MRELLRKVFLTQNIILFRTRIVGMDVHTSDVRVTRSKCSCLSGRSLLHVAVTKELCLLTRFEVISPCSFLLSVKRRFGVMSEGKRGA